jgi:hypothetical protein
MDDTPNARLEPETRGAAPWHHVDAGHVRRGLQFLINIGVPLLVGVLRGESQIALAAVIVGMAFGFADSAGPLFSRLRFLALDALCIGVGAGLAISPATMRLCWCRFSSASRWGSVWRR